MNRQKPQVKFLTPWDFPYFRGTVRIGYADETAEQITPSVTRYVHLWHRLGQVLDPLFTVNLAPRETRTVRVDFRYPLQLRRRF